MTTGGDYWVTGDTWAGRVYATSGLGSLLPHRPRWNRIAGPTETDRGRTTSDGQRLTYFALWPVLFFWSGVVLSVLVAGLAAEAAGK